MIPTKVTAENVATYGKLEWEIPSGLSSVLGRNELSDGADSNGAGKSTLLSLVPLALFGPSLPWSEILAKGEESCRVELEFEHGDEMYRVRRVYNAKGRGKTTLDFEERVGQRLEYDNSKEYVADWDALTQESQAETQLAITRTIGLSAETFGHSVFSAQGARHFASPELQPRERKQVLAEVLDLGSWDALLELVRSDIRAAETEVAALAMRIGDLEAEQESEDELQGKLDEVVVAVSMLANRVDAAEVARGRAVTLLSDAEQAAKEREGLQREVDRLIARAAEAETARTEAVTLAAQIDALAEQAAGLEALEADLKVREAAEASRTAVAENRRQALLRIKELRRLAQSSREIGLAFTVRGKELKARHTDLVTKGMGVCNECGQKLAGEALQTALNTLDAELQILRDQLAAATKDAAEKEADAVEAEKVLPPEAEPGLDLAGLRRDVAEAREATVKVAAGRERLDGLIRLAALDESFQEELDTAKAALTNADAVDPQQLVALQRAVGDANMAVIAARDSLQDAQQEQTRCEERLGSLAAAAQKAQESLAARERLNTRLDLLKALETAYGRNGIPALILETSAIPQLEAEAQRILAELGVPYRIELVTQRETKSGTLKDTLDVVVHEPAGPRRYETYSGGEQTRLEFALRIALARLVASRHGSESGILALDELQYLDASGMAQVANVLRGLTEFRSVLLVSHDDRLSEAFDQQIVVVRDEDGSRLEEIAA